MAKRTKQKKLIEPGDGLEQDNTLINHLDPNLVASLSGFVNCLSKLDTRIKRWLLSQVNQNNPWINTFTLIAIMCNENERLHGSTYQILSNLNLFLQDPLPPQNQDIKNFDPNKAFNKLAGINPELANQRKLNYSSMQIEVDKFLENYPENISTLLSKYGTVQKRSKNGDRTFTNYATDCRPVITEQSRQSGLEVITR